MISFLRYHDITNSIEIFNDLSERSLSFKKFNRNYFNLLKDLGCNAPASLFIWIVK